MYSSETFRALPLNTITQIYFLNANENWVKILNFRRGIAPNRPAVIPTLHHFKLCATKKSIVLQAITVI
jgi:hypothetical protein